MIQPHPSLLLVLDVDESLATEETRQEIRRCYGYVGSTVIRPHSTPADGPITNIMEMQVKLTGAKYLRENTPDADELWNQAIERWLFNQFHTIGNQMQIYNRRQREEGNNELYFDWLNVVFEGGSFTARVKLNSVSSLPPECSKVMTCMREALRNREIDEDVDCIFIPSPNSYQAQALAWEEAEPEREAARAEAERVLAEEEANRKREAEIEAAESFDEAPDLAPKPADELSEEFWQAKLERKYSLPDPDFEIDYSIWGVVGSDGLVREYDSSNGRYLDDGTADQLTAV